MAVYDDCDVYIISFPVLGIITLNCLTIYLVWQLCKIIYNIFNLHCLPNVQLSKKVGSWAIITGCTDGLGKAYAKELASRGLNLVLISRSTKKLQQTAKEIVSEHPVQTKIITADFSTGSKAIETIKDELRNIPPIGILGEVPEQTLWDIINVNVGAVTMMTRLLIQGMKERGRGAIVNVSSVGECQPVPLGNVYSSTKVYIKHFSEALREEYSKDGITVQHLSPTIINTKMIQFVSSVGKYSLLATNPTSYAKYAINTLGKVNHTTGYWTHGIQYFFVNLAPIWIRIKCAKVIAIQLRKDYLLENLETTNS